MLLNMNKRRAMPITYMKFRCKKYSKQEKFLYLCLVALLLYLTLSPQQKQCVAPSL